MIDCISFAAGDGDGAARAAVLLGVELYLRMSAIASFSSLKDTHYVHWCVGIDQKVNITLQVSIVMQ